MTAIGLLLSCSAPEEKQFAGVRSLMARLAAETRGALYAEWRGQTLDFRRRRRLALALASGHGSRDEAAFLGPPGERCLTPGQLRLPAQAKLYLLGCYQGKPDLRRAWAAGTGIAVERVQGHDGETESALSTCLLLHLLEDGLEAVDGWFAAWRRCNADLEKHFPLLRAAYAECAGDPLLVWAKVRELPALRPHQEFVGAALRHPEYLAGLA
jgi:hypothetical protein